MSEKQERRWPAVMVDLETLGTSAQAAVIEIGAVCFDLETRTMGPRYEAQIALESNGHHERKIEAGTLAWWMGLWRERGVVPDLTRGVTVDKAVWDLEQFWKAHAAHAAQFWSRGSFDEVILRDMFQGLGGEPWKFRHVRDQRTVTAWAKRPRREEVSHGALQDAIDQVKELFACLPAEGSGDANPNIIGA